MRTIGPYVVRREVTPHRAGAGPSGDGAAGRRFFARTLRATDRLTGMPVLLHPLEATVPVPQLPAHPSLLPFTGLVAEVAHSYLVTELPLPAEPESDPERAARGALEALAFLHGQGLTHGALDSGQFWRVGGAFKLSGAGLPRPGLHPAPADDLHDLGAALADLGPLPPALSGLRENPGALSARELLSRLSGEPALLLEPTPPFEVWDTEESDQPGTDELLVGGAATEAPPPPTPPTSPALASPPASSPTPEAEPGPAREPRVSPRPPVPFDLILTSEPLKAPTPEPPKTAPPAAPQRPSSALWTPEEGEIAEVRRRGPDEGRGKSPEQPEREGEASKAPPAGRRHAASRASERLKADTRRMLDHTAQRRDQVAAQVAAQANSDGAESGEAGEGSRPPAPSLHTETPQERRHREFQARQEEEALREQLAALRQANPEAAQPDAAENLADLAEIRRTTRQAAPASAAPPPTVRQLGPIRMGWDRKGERQVIRAVSPRQQLLRWLLPVLGVLVLAFAVSLLVRALRPAPAAPSAACCAVRLQLAGVGAGERAALTLVRAPQGVSLAPGSALGELPGEVRFPGPGLYRVQVSTVPPAAPRTRTLDLRVPNADLLTVSLRD